LSVHILKRRGGEVAQPIRIDLAARWSTAPGEAVATGVQRVANQAPAAADPRSREGRDAAERARVRRSGGAAH
jgi:hypothetical protein